MKTTAVLTKPQPMPFSVHTKRACIDEMEETEELTKVRKFLRQFLVVEDAEGDVGGDKTVVTLAPINTIKMVLNSKTCQLTRIQERITKLILDWHNDLFRNGDAPTLIGLGYGNVEREAFAGVYALPPSSAAAAKPGDDDDEDDDDDDESTSNRKPAAVVTKKSAIGNMRKARESLGRGTVDPLPESLKAAAQASKRRQRRDSDEDESSTEKPAPKRQQNKKKDHDSKYKRKASAKTLTFDDTDSDEDISENEGREEEENVRSVNLSALPKARARSPARKPKKERSSLSSPPKKRRRFTDDEIRAIRKGVRTLGAGHWAEIKGLFPEILKNRTNVQIKVSISFILLDKVASIVR